MKNTTRGDFRVEVTLKGHDLSVLGLGNLPGHIISGDIPLTIAPHRLGDFGWMSIPDSMTSRDPERDYEQRCRDLLTEIRQQHPGTTGKVTWTEEHTCSHCDLTWEVLTAADATNDDATQDAHSIAGEPVCCYAAITEFRTEHGIPALPEDGGS